VAAKDSVTIREGLEQVSSDVLDGSTTIPSIGNLNPIHSQLTGTLNDTAGPALKLSNDLLKQKIEEVLKVLIQ
jgi:hypothetical protein